MLGSVQPCLLRHAPDVIRLLTRLSMLSMLLRRTRIAVALGLSFRFFLLASVHQSHDELPLLRSHGGDTQAGLLEGLEVLERCVGGRVRLQVVQRNEMIELASELDMDNAPLGIVAARGLVVVRMGGVKCRFYLVSPAQQGMISQTIW